jgi:hypothetical protein
VEATRNNGQGARDKGRRVEGDGPAYNAGGKEATQRAREGKCK